MTSGNPAAEKLERIHAYLVLDVIVELAEGIDPGQYHPEAIEAGTMLLRYDNPGTGSHSFVFEDGPFKTIVTAVYVAAGTMGEHGSEFDYGNGRVMNLISLGLEGETVLKTQIHDVLDKVRETIERETSAGKVVIGTPLRLIEAIDELESSLWRKH